MKDFNVEYGAKVDMYIKSCTTLTITKPDGSEWKLYADATEDAICITQAPEYRIPPEIQELLTIKRVTKLHAYPITLRIDTFLNWDNMCIGTFCGVSWRGNLTCTICGVHTKYNYFGKWYCANLGTVCCTCYDSDPEYKKRGFQYMDITAFNVTDWVRFCEIDKEFSQYSFYTNCNLQSPYYGQVMLCDDDESDFGAQFHIIGDAHTFITYITDWMRVTGTATMMMRECLNVPIKMHSVYDKAWKYGIVKKGETLTVRDVLSNTNTLINGPALVPGLITRYRKRKSRGEWGWNVIEGRFSWGDLTDEEIVKMAKKYAISIHGKHVFKDSDIQTVRTHIQNITVYTEEAASTFPAWLRDQLK